MLKKFIGETEDIENDISDNGEYSESMDYMVQINAIMEKLSEEDREIIVLRFVNEEPISYICKVTGLSRFALYRRIKTIKKQLSNS